MKKYFSIALASLALIALSAACSKEKTVDDGTPVEPVAKTMTIKATISDAATRVTFDPAFDDSFKPTKMAHTWETGDKLRITDSSNPANTAVFDLVDGAGTATGTFQGTGFEAASYDVEAIPVGTFNTSTEQTQAKDGATDHLQFVATATGVTDLEDFSLTETSGIIAVIAKLPAGVAGTINALEIEAKVPNYPISVKFTINLTEQEDVDSDDVLKLYANAPMGFVVPAGADGFLRFKSTNANHTVYTRYQKFATMIKPVAGKFNYVKMNCANIDKYAGGADDGTSANPYLIADKYQMKAMADLAEAGATTCFKMLTDIDLSGESWTSVNPDPFTAVVNLDGNGKEVKGLDAPLFDDLNGSVVNLGIDDAVVTNRTAITGILANTIKTGSSTVDNVILTDGTVSSSSYAGGLIGQIDKSGTSVTNCEVLGTTVTGSLAGGVIGFANAQVTVSDCVFSGSVTASGRYAGGLMGSTGNFASTISDCEVVEATVKGDNRVGGSIGQIQTKVSVSNCTVKSTSVTGANINTGGFVGVNYGSVSACDVLSSTTVQSDNATATTPINLGGFVGYNTGTVSNCTAVANISQTGTSIGGFVGYQLQNGKIEGSSCTGTLTATGGGKNDGGDKKYYANGGFVGVAEAGTLTKNHSSLACTIGNYGGGFGGIIRGGTVSKCYSTGDISGNTNNIGGFIGFVAGAVTVSDSYSTGSLSSTNQRIGGFVGLVETSADVTIERCYTSGDVLSPSFSAGGLIARISGATCTVKDCAAWNAVVKATSVGSVNWSSGAVVGVTFPTCTLTNNYRNPAMKLTAYWGTETGYTTQLTADFDHADVSSTAPLTDSTGAAMTDTALASGQAHYPQYPYQGHVDAGKTLSRLASTTLGWSSDVWDFSGELPTLK